MSFGSFPTDSYENWKDVGLVYTRNKYGRVSSPPGYGLKDKKHCSDYKNSLLKGASCSVSADGDTLNPCSLFNICLDFVAKNLSMVESLEGFPDIVGEQLFKKVQENDEFDSCPKNLRLFCEAYGELVLSKLSLTSEHILANNYLEYLQLFVFLVELDVSHCRLGNTHELLAYISHLHGLEKLSLKDNCLSDVGVKKITLPQRLLKDGLGKLSVLDLSLNPGISDSSMKYLAKINSLTALNLSGTAVTFRSGVPQLVNQTNLCLSLEVDCFKSDKAFTENEGWAADVVNHWMKKSKDCSTINKATSTALGDRRRNFYKSTRSEVMQKLTEAKKNRNSSELPVIMLTLKENQLTCLQYKMLQSHTAQEGDNKNSEDHHPRKKFKTSGGIINSSNISNEDTFEDDLFKEYLNFSSKCKPVKRQGSLLESLDCIG